MPVSLCFVRLQGSASTADIQLTSLKATVEQACAIAQFTEKDTASGLADAERMATEFHDLDLWHPYAISADQAVEMALQTESAGREFDRRISNSDGASMSHGDSVAVYANSHGFAGAERSTHFQRSC